MLAIMAHRDAPEQFGLRRGTSNRPSIRTEKARKLPGVVDLDRTVTATIRIIMVFPVFICKSCCAKLFTRSLPAPDSQQKAGQNLGMNKKNQLQ